MKGPSSLRRALDAANATIAVLRREQAAADRDRATFNRVVAEKNDAQATVVSLRETLLDADNRARAAEKREYEAQLELGALKSHHAVVLQLIEMLYDAKDRS